MMFNLVMAHNASFAFNAVSECLKAILDGLQRREGRGGSAF